MLEIPEMVWVVYCSLRDCWNIDKVENLNLSMTSEQSKKISVCRRFVAVFVKSMRKVR
jgi:hypothetical protein